MVGVVERVGRVGVDLEHEVVAEPLADRGDAIDVEARLDLQLDPQVAVVEIPGDLFEQLRDIVGDPDGHPGGHPVGDRAEVLGERPAGGAQLGIEHRHLQRRLGHRMSFEDFQQRADVLGLDVAAVEQPRGEEVGDDVFGAVDVFGRVPRLGPRHALAPADHRRPVDGALGPHEENVSITFRAE